MDLRNAYIFQSKKANKLRTNALKHTNIRQGFYPDMFSSDVYGTHGVTNGNDNESNIKSPQIHSQFYYIFPHCEDDSFVMYSYFVVYLAARYPISLYFCYNFLYSRMASLCPAKNFKYVKNLLFWFCIVTFCRVQWLLLCPSNSGC